MSHGDYILTIITLWYRVWIECFDDDRNHNNDNKDRFNNKSHNENKDASDENNSNMDDNKK